jgi:hypothetical protein
MTARPTNFQESYSAAFAAYLRDPSEAALHAAYELGRDAVARELSILDLAALHHDALKAALTNESGSSQPGRVVTAANDFLRETLSAFEMVRRGFRDAQAAAKLEKRHATIVRQLATFLADTSVALQTPDSLAEVLQLVAEQARELTGAACSVARVVMNEPEARIVEASSYPETDERWRAFLSETDLAGLAKLVGPGNTSLRLGSAEVADASTSRILNRPVRGWLAATLTGWDEEPLGFIELFEKTNGDFSETDEAVVLHLAQMAVTAIERARWSTRSG